MSEASDARTRVGRNILRVRRARGISQERLAELAGNTAKHIGQIERGEVNVGLDILARIARALTVDLADLCAQRRRRRGERGILLVDSRELTRLEQFIRNARRAPLFPPDEDPV